MALIGGDWIRRFAGAQPRPIQSRINPMEESIMKKFAARFAAAVVLLVMNPRGARAILNNKVKLGADASAAAGPKGRNAEASTDVTLRAEVLTYSRARGLFAGISLAGSTVRPDNGANEKVYGKKVEATDIIFKGKVAVPGPAQNLVAYLNQNTPKNLSDPESLK